MSDKGFWKRQERRVARREPLPSDSVAAVAGAHRPAPLHHVETLAANLEAAMFARARMDALTAMHRVGACECERDRHWHRDYCHRPIDRMPWWQRRFRWWDVRTIERKLHEAEASRAPRVA